MIQYSNTKVTLELRDVLATKDENGNPFNLWDFDYPSFYKDDDKAAFEQLVIDHYYFHQIGCETIARFKHNFKTRMREIMPYYIQMYESVEIMKKIPDPFGNVDMTETFEQTSTGSSSGSSSHSENGCVTSSDTSSKADNASSTSTESAEKTDNKTATENTEHRFSNTPQGSISNLNNYLTEASIDDKDQTEKITSSGTVSTSQESESTSNGTSNSESETTASGTSSSESENSGTVKHTLTRKGNQGVNTYAHDMIEYRQSFINVDMMIIGALRDLFLLIY